jgi:hypothetical protein
MSDEVKKKDRKVKVTWTNWGRTYQARLHTIASHEAIRVFKSNVEEKTLMECMVPIYKNWERHHDMGEKGVYKPSDLIQLYGIKEV